MNQLSSSFGIERYGGVGCKECPKRKGRGTVRIGSVGAGVGALVYIHYTACSALLNPTQQNKNFVAFVLDFQAILLYNLVGTDIADP